MGLTWPLTREVWQDAGMGAWGTAIFSNDTASDIRIEYREYVQDRVPDDEATRRTIASFAHLVEREDGELWIPLAAAQSEVGRLDADVRTRAIAAIDRGADLELWAEAGPGEVAKRTAALDRLREKLLGPQPAPKRLRRSWRHVEDDLAPGDVLAFTAPNGRTALFRVAGIHRSRYGDSPELDVLDWVGEQVPGPEALATLRAKREPASFSLPERPVVWRPDRFRKTDPVWHEVGFVRVARFEGWPNRPGQTPGHSGLWRVLNLVVTRDLLDGTW